MKIKPLKCLFKKSHVNLLILTIFFQRERNFASIHYNLELFKCSESIEIQGWRQNCGTVGQK